MAGDSRGKGTWTKFHAVRFLISHRRVFLPVLVTEPESPFYCEPVNTQRAPLFRERAAKGGQTVT